MDIVGATLAVALKMNILKIYKCKK